MELDIQRQVKILAKIARALSAEAQKIKKAQQQLSIIIKEVKNES